MSAPATSPEPRPLTNISSRSTLVGSAFNPEKDPAAFALPAAPRLLPTPAAPHTHPKPNQFDLASLRSLPRRLFSPPRPSPSSAAALASSAGAGSQRMANVHLADVLANKHLSPLSLVDFEGYLAHKELSAENLYFVLWLAEYTKLWRAHECADARLSMASATDPTTGPPGPARLALLPEVVQASLNLGLDTFLSPNAPLELNLSFKLRDLTLAAAGETGHPDAFAPARDHVLAALERSLGGFKRVLAANAGLARLGMCFALGCVMFAIGLVPSVVAIAGGHSRWWHLLGWPSLMLGAATASMAPQRVCAAVWFLGNDRQMLPWEVRPTCLSASLVAIPRPGSPSFGSEASSTHSASSANPFPWAKFENLAPTTNPDEPTVPAPVTHARSSSISSVSFPPPDPSSSPPTSPALGPGLPPPYSVQCKSREAGEATAFLTPVTRVLSDDVAREHWRVVRRGFMIGFVVMCVVGGGLMAV